MITLCIDFDGVIHSYESGWQGEDVIADPPVNGAIEWLIALVEEESIEVCIYSSRSKQEKGIALMQEWLLAHGMPKEIAAQIKFPTQKPAAFLTIDDRCICFDGTFPTTDLIFNFKPWNKKGV